MSTRRGRAREIARMRDRQAQLSNANEVPPLQAETTRESLAKASQSQTSSAEAHSTARVWFDTQIRRARLIWRRFWSITRCFWFDKTQIITWALRVVTVLGFSYLVIERIYESNLTVSIVASDPEDPFRYPFSINNNSHLWSMSNIQWRCLLISIDAPPNVHLVYNVLASDTVSNIPAGQNLNISCPASSMIVPMPKITTAVIKIALSYDVNIDLWIIHRLWHRYPDPTLFTWAGRASNPQWIRGEFAK
jgi:hypothetical protein